MNWKGYKRKQPWINLSYYPGICLMELRKLKKNLSEYQVPELKFNPKLLE
jgi:hypothetical protein